MCWRPETGMIHELEREKHAGLQTTSVHQRPTTASSYTTHPASTLHTQSHPSVPNPLPLKARQRFDFLLQIQEAELERLGGGGETTVCYGDSHPGQSAGWMM